MQSGLCKGGFPGCWCVDLATGTLSGDAQGYVCAQCLPPYLMASCPVTVTGPCQLCHSLWTGCFLSISDCRWLSHIAL